MGERVIFRFLSGFRWRDPEISLRILWFRVAGINAPSSLMPLLSPVATMRLDPHLMEALLNATTLK